MASNDPPALYPPRPARLQAALLTTIPYIHTVLARHPVFARAVALPMSFSLFSAQVICLMAQLKCPFLWEALPDLSRQN